MAIWADATFVWNPGDASNPSFDEISTNTAGGLTEGTFVTSPRDGRTYSGSVGSRFDGLVAAANPHTSGMTLMAAVNSPSASESIRGFFVGDKDSSGKWAQLIFNISTSHLAGYRVGGSSAGDSNWPRAEYQLTPDTSIHVMVARYTISGTEMLIDLFLDGTLVASDLESISGGNIDIDRITVGRTDDASPGDSNGGGVYAAASWDRPLTDSEIRALSSDPYSYPTDPSDPDNWEEGAVGSEWEDVAFYWDPNHAGDRGINRLYGGATSTESLTEGTEVTVSTQEGRQYDGTQGSRFNIIPLNVTDRFAFWPRSDITLMVVLARPATTSDGKALYAGDRELSSGWATLSWDDADVAHEGDVRRSQSASTPGGANWPIANIAGTDADTDLHTLVLTFEIVSGDGTVTIYRDDLATTASDTEAFTAEAQALINRFTVGRQDDASPGNSTDMQVFAAAAWGRLLSSSEISAVLADPYGFPGEASVAESMERWGFIPI